MSAAHEVTIAADRGFERLSWAPTWRQLAMTLPWYCVKQDEARQARFVDPRCARSLADRAMLLARAGYAIKMPNHPLIRTPLQTTALSFLSKWHVALTNYGMVVPSVTNGCHSCQRGNQPERILDVLNGENDFTVSRGSTMKAGSVHL